MRCRYSRRGAAATSSASAAEVNSAVEHDKLVATLNKNNDGVLRLNPRDEILSDIAPKRGTDADDVEYCLFPDRGLFVSEKVANGTRWFLKMHNDGPHLWICKPTVLSREKLGFVANLNSSYKILILQESLVWNDSKPKGDPGKNIDSEDMEDTDDEKEDDEESDEEQPLGFTGSKLRSWNVLEVGRILKASELKLKQDEEDKRLREVQNGLVETTSAAVALNNSHECS